jgi:hypothetical protein
MFWKSSQFLNLFVVVEKIGCGKVNMLVSHMKKFIFLKTVKTGSTSTEIFLQDQCVAPGTYRDLSEINEWLEKPLISEFGIVGSRGPTAHINNNFFNHMHGSQIRNEIGSDIWQEYFKVANIRNPWSKVISHFFYAGISREINPKNLSQLELRKLASEHALNYNIEEVECFFKAPVESMDFYIRFENLADDMRFLSLRLGIPTDRNLPYFKAGSWSSSSTAYRDFFTESAKNHVGDVYQGWIRNFKYSF